MGVSYFDGLFFISLETLFTRCTKHCVHKQYFLFQYLAGGVNTLVVFTRSPSSSPSSPSASSSPSPSASPSASTSASSSASPSPSRSPSHSASPSPSPTSSSSSPHPQIPIKTASQHLLQPSSSLPSRSPCTSPSLVTSPSLTSSPILLSSSYFSPPRFNLSPSHPPPSSSRFDAFDVVRNLPPRPNPSFLEAHLDAMVVGVVIIVVVVVVGVIIFFWRRVYIYLTFM